MDLSKLEVSLTLTNKFEGLETDSEDTSAQSLLLRWVTAALAPALKWPLHLPPGLSCPLESSPGSQLAFPLLPSASELRCSRRQRRC